MHVICDPSILWSQGPMGLCPGRTDRRADVRTVERNGAWTGLLLFLHATFSYQISLRFFSHYPGRSLLFVFYHRPTRFRSFPIPLRVDPSRARYSAAIFSQSAAYMPKKRKNKILNVSWMIAGLAVINDYRAV